MGAGPKTDDSGETLAAENKDGAERVVIKARFPALLAADGLTAESVSVLISVAEAPPAPETASRRGPAWRALAAGALVLMAALIAGLALRRPLPGFLSRHLKA